MEQLASTSRTSRAAGGRGFTLVETLFTVAVVALLVGLLVVGLRVASRVANRATEQHNIASLTIGCEQFKSDFGFPPPLVEDFDPANTDDDSFVVGGDNRTGPLFEPNNAPAKPVAYLSTTDPQRYLREDRYLRGREPGSEGTPIKADYRFSTYSLAYYLLGALGKDSQDNLIDGVDGAGFLKPNADGTFRTTGGKRYQPLFDTSKGVKGAVAVNAAEGRIELQDRRGVPYRYYLWRQGEQQTPNQPDTLEVKTSADLNVPRMLGNPDENPDLRNAEYAIVAAGANGVFGDWWTDQSTETPAEIKAAMGVSDGMNDERAAAMAREDNIVGVGR